VFGLALALTACDGPSPQAGVATPAVTPSSPTQTPSPAGVWETLRGCGPAVPGALRVQYQGAPNANGVQRSDDCGATWRDLPNPQIPGVANGGSITLWVVSAAPAYTDTVYVTTLVLSDPQLCSASRCQVQYVSTDGGQSWVQVKLPAPGYLGALSAAAPPASGSGGARLYGIVTDEIMAVGPAGSVSPPMRLVTSMDHGATWKLCDDPIAAQGQEVAQYAAPPSGSDIYLVAIPRNDNSGTPPETVWASHDAGATWSARGSTPGTGTAQTREGTPGGQVSAVFAGQDGASGRSILYLTVVVQGHERAVASADGGQTWQRAATLLLDADANGYSLTFLGTLPDGSLVLEYPAGDGGTVAWKPGSIVRTVAQNPGFRDFFNPLLAPNASGVALWLSGDVGPDATRSVKYTQLQL
jgi:hypothetical protein